MSCKAKRYLERETKHVLHVVAVIVKELLYALGQHLCVGRQKAHHVSHIAVG
jgi:hypothetical protein